MRYVNADRQVLVDLLGRSDAFVSLKRAKRTSDLFHSNEELTLVWDDAGENESASLPNVIFVVEDKLEDFLAWSATYLRAVRPLTAFCRVASREAATPLLDIAPPHDLRAISNACLGLILGEAAMYMGPGENLVQLPSIAVERTFSFSMARLIGLGMPGTELPFQLNRWSKARQFGRSSSAIVSERDLDVTWGVMLSVFFGADSLGNADTKSDNKIVEICRGILLSEFDSVDFEKLGFGGSAALNDVLRRMTDTKEERVKAFERAQNDLGVSKGENPTRYAFLIGFLASRIEPGSMEHIELLRTASRDYPSAILWYGLCAGLSREAKLQQANGGLGRRLLRDALRPATILDRPTCDIALHELEVLSRIGNVESIIPVSRSGYLEVEIAPCVNTVVRTGKSGRNQSDLFPPSPESPAVRDIASGLEQEITAIYDAYNKLRSIVHPSSNYSGPSDHNAPGERSKRRWKK